MKFKCSANADEYFKEMIDTITYPSAPFTMSYENISLTVNGSGFMIS